MKKSTVTKNRVTKLSKILFYDIIYRNVQTETFTKNDTH
jgi:hypothetical protein